MEYLFDMSDLDGLPEVPEPRADEEPPQSEDADMLATRVPTPDGPPVRLTALLGSRAAQFDADLLLTDDQSITS